LGETADAQSVLNSQPIGADHLRLMLPLLFDDRSDARFGESPRAIVSEDEPPS